MNVASPPPDEYDASAAMIELSSPSLPAAIRDVEQLEDLLSDPSAAAVESVRRSQGDFIVLGVGGKMGPTLARMLARSAQAAGRRCRVIGVSRFGSDGLREKLQSHGIETIACDLLDPDALQKLPDAPNIVYMAGMKFGATGQQARTWAMNAWLPGMVARRYRGSRIVAFSTGNVYPLSSLRAGGCTEADDPAPIGEYAMSCLGRERVLEHFSRTYEIPMVLLRLNYAVEMRYGVLVDLARKVFADETIDLAMGNFNAIWQGDANAMAIAAFELASAPPRVLNLTGPELLSVRAVCLELGRIMGKEPRFIGSEGGESLLSNAQRCNELLGYPRVPIRRAIAWTADWIARGGATLGKPTHFETRDGKF